MRGFVFTEFIEMIEERHGLDVVDQMIAASGSSCGGSYVSVDTYPHEEFARLIGSLAAILGADPPELIRWFGEQLFGRLAVVYAGLLEDIEDPFTLLERLDGYVHFEVKKLEPDAQLPSFDFTSTGPGSATMTYRSERALPDLAEGLLTGCFAHFGDRASIRRTDRSGGAGTQVDFHVERKTDPERG